MVTCKEQFTRLVYSFVLTGDQGSGRRWQPLPDLELKDVELEAPVRPTRGGPQQVWIETTRKELKKMARRLASPVADYLVGEGYARPLVRVFEWKDDSLNALLRELETVEEKSQHRTRFLFDITDVRLFLFDTGVGLLSFEFVLREVTEEVFRPSQAAPGAGTNARTKEGVWEASERRSPTLDDLIAFNYRMRTLRDKAREEDEPTNRDSPCKGGHGKGNHLPTMCSRARKRAASKRAEAGTPPADAGDDEFLRDLLNGEEFTLEALKEWSLSGLRQKCEAMGAALEEVGPPFLVGLTYARVPASSPGEGLSEAELAPSLFRLRRFYGPNYQPVPIGGGPDPEVYRPFFGVWHGISIEGMATLVLDDGRTEFFNEMSDRVRSNYFTLFLLALHQRVALEFLSTCSSRFKRVSVAECPPDTAEVVQAARALRSAAFHFTLHHTFPWVGAVTMYQEVYERLMAAMRLRELHDDLRDDLRELDELLERMHRETREAGQRFLETVVALLFPLTLLLAFWGTNFKEIVTDSQSKVGLFDPKALWSYAVTAIMILGLMVFVHRAWLRRVVARIWGRQSKRPSLARGGGRGRDNTEQEGRQ